MIGSLGMRLRGVDWGWGFFVLSEEGRERMG